MTSSAIIASLAAQAYEGHQSVVEALQSVVQRMGKYVRPNAPRVPNPRYLEEDFADRWVKMPPDRESAFREWHGVMLESISRFSQFRLHNANTVLSPILGEDVANCAMLEFDDEGVSALRRDKNLGVRKGVGLVSLTGSAAATSKAEETTFFGD